MPTQEKVIQIANYFIKKLTEEPEKGLDAKKLQKLLYYSQAWSLVLREKPIFEDKIEAWIHGPAVYKVWDAFKFHIFSSLSESTISNEDIGILDEEEKKFLDNIWTIYGKFDGEYLEALTHSELPWQEARRGIDEREPSSKEISHDSMKIYYGKRLADAEKRGA